MEIKKLISEEEIDKRLNELAMEIDNYYQGKELIVLCIMRGAIYFMTDLTKKMKTPIIPDFITVSSYEGTSSTGNIKLLQDLKEDIKGKDVLVIEDIIDSGRTMHYLMEYLGGKEPNSLKLCVLADKKVERVYDVNVDFTAFNLPNKFVVGYGFDIDNKYRNIPYIGYVEE